MNRKTAKQFSITLGNEQWKVKLADEPPKINAVECAGYCEAGKKKIVVWREVPEAERRETFIHELLHALFWHYDEEWIETVAVQIDDALTAFEESFDKGTEG